MEEKQAAKLEDISLTVDNGNEGKVVFTKDFHTNGTLRIVTGGDIMHYKSDVIVSSIDAKKHPTDDVLSRGVLAQQFGRNGGKALRENLASSERACWTYGELIVTESHDFNKGVGSPSHIFHFCLMNEYEGKLTYQSHFDDEPTMDVDPPLMDAEPPFWVDEQSITTTMSSSCSSLDERLRSLFERALNIAHDLVRDSIAFPMVGAGLLAYPPIEVVVKALIDACSLFREKDSPLKNVTLVIWKNDVETQKVIEEECVAFLNSYTPVGKGYKIVVPDVLDYSNPETAFRKSMGSARTLVSVEVLPIGHGAPYERYNIALEKVKRLRPHLASVERYGWHGTRGDFANNIAKNGFDKKQAGKSCGTVYGKGAYFANQAEIAHPYSIPGGYISEFVKKCKSLFERKKKEMVHTMILCKLITGEQQLGNSNLISPDPGYDSAKNRDNTYYIIFDRDYILPIAIIEYQLDKEIEKPKTSPKPKPAPVPRPSNPPSNDSGCTIL